MFDSDSDSDSEALPCFPWLTPTDSDSNVTDQPINRLTDSLTHLILSKSHKNNGIA